MKPDCRRVLSQIASYSVEELSSDDVNAFTRHLDDCPPCKGQWLLFERTLTTLSQTPEAEIEVERSHQMWIACLCHAQSKKKSLVSATALNREVMPKPSRSDLHGLEGDRQSSKQLSKNRISSRLQSLSLVFKPQFGYALAGSAALALGASYFLSPSEPVSEPRIANRLPAMPALSAATVSFQTPPQATTGMLDYHSAMAFEPFPGHVAPTLVSYTATQP